MKILANENIPIDSINYLIEKGFDVKSVALESFGISDLEVINFAISEETIIITFDRDYGELILKYKIKPKQGIIYLRLDEYSSVEPDVKINYLLSELKIDTLNKLTVYNGESIRQRNY